MSFRMEKCLKVKKVKKGKLINNLISKPKDFKV